MFGNTPAASKVHPQVRHIFTGLKRRLYLRSNLKSEATEKWLARGSAYTFKLCSDKQEFCTGTGWALYYQLSIAMSHM